MKMFTSLKIPAFQNKTWRGFFIILVLLALPLSDILAGVLVAPSIVILSDKNRTGRLNLQNPSNTPKEVSISFSFGIPESDSLGNVNIHLKDSAVTDPRSALGWIKAFPRKLIIPANGSQIVRFVANPPKNLTDGEYWARIVVESQEGATSIPLATKGDKITTKLNMIMRTAVMIKYRTGDLVAALKLNDAQAKKKDSLINVLVDLSNEGNVSYIGLLKCRLVDAEGKEISKNKIQLAVYHDLKRSMTLPLKDGNYKKPYKVEVTITNKGRKDIPVDEMVFGNDISYTMTLNN